jgi:hypothetical protein
MSLDELTDLFDDLPVADLTEEGDALEPMVCPDCGRIWTALREAHCAACCRHFSSDSAFDAHIFPPPPYGPRPFKTCCDPARLRKGGKPKLICVDLPEGRMWSWPGSRSGAFPGSTP